MATISVIIPTYNSQDTILETIESVQNQTFSDFEIVVINDGSTDLTLEILNAIKDERIQIYSYENGGVSLARNRGISHAKGEYIAFMDADDLWTADKLELQLIALQNNSQAALAYSWTYIMSEDGKQAHKCAPVIIEGNVYTRLITANFIIGISSNILVRKAVIDDEGNFDTSLSHYEDWDLCLRFARNWSFVVVPKYQVFYRQSNNSASSNIKAFEKSVLTVIERSLKYLPQEFQKLKFKSMANCHVYWTQLYLARFSGFASLKQARNHLFTAISLYPKILLDRKTQIFLCKLLLMHILTPKIAGNMLKFLSDRRVVQVNYA